MKIQCSISVFTVRVCERWISLCSADEDGFQYRSVEVRITSVKDTPVQQDRSGSGEMAAATEVPAFS